MTLACGNIHSAGCSRRDGLTYLSTLAYAYRKEVSVSVKFGELLKQLRQENELGIKRLAPELGVDYSYLSKLENNKASPSDELIERVARYFNYDKDLLYISADKIPLDAMEAIRERPQEVLRYLRGLSRIDRKRRE
jgi:transcriptional regulator with XRE-family HTH domain